MVKAYDAYWDFRAQSLGTNTVDLREASSVASALGIGQITAYVAQQKAKGQHAAGEITTNVMGGVQLKGSTAQLSDCVLNSSYDVNTSTGAQLSEPGGLVTVLVTLVKQPSGWVVANINPTEAACTVPSA